MTLSDEYIPIHKAAARIPGRPSLATVWRWVLKGCNGIRLDSVMIGGRRFVTVEQIERFIAESTAAANRQATPVVRTPRQRAAAIAAAEHELDAAGI